MTLPQPVGRSSRYAEERIRHCIEGVSTVGDSGVSRLLRQYLFEMLDG
jgi:hypothetical protein